MKVKKRKKMYSVWESDWNGRDYPTFYEEKEKEKAFQHFEASKKDKPQYVSIRECIVENWGTDDTEIIEEDNIQSYYSEFDSRELNL